MADDSNYRFRANDGRPPAKAPVGNDPLAELARLIGQTDPFAEFGKQPRAEVHHAPSHAAPAQSWNAPPVAPEQGYDDYDQRGAGVHPDHGQQNYDNAQAAQGYDDQYYHDDATEVEDAYDDVPPRRRFNVIAIAAVFGLVVVGTAGAVGYRALFGSSGTTPPPVIKADTAPTKVVPANKSEPQSNKLIYDRVGERGSGEKVVSREEQPVDINKLSQQPLMPNAANAPSSGGASIAPAANAAPAPLDQPKKVRTIAIRPDQPQSASDSPPAAASAAVPAPRPTPVKPAAPPQRLASAPPISTVDAEDAAPPRPASARQAQAGPSHNAPLSLNPNAAAPAPARADPVRTASAPPPAPRAPSAPVASGEYAVQVSSQRSEADAEAAFRSLQGKFPSQLGGRQPLIRRADLGSKGVYYRAMVGPFANGGDASALCQSLKAAGGSCLIQKN